VVDGEDPEITKVTDFEPLDQFEFEAAVARTVQLPAAVNVRTPLDGLTVQSVVPALVTA
jgi:hypothetical protein